MEIRQVRYEIINKEHQRKAGIYVMYIGDMIYIGKAKQIQNRITFHRSVENRSLFQYSINKKPKARCNRAILKHLVDNPDINTIFIEIVEISDTPDRLDELEMIWIETAIKIGFKEILLNVETYNYTYMSYQDLRSIGLI